jgi:hypothetical protein
LFITQRTYRNMYLGAFCGVLLLSGSSCSFA